MKTPLGVRFEIDPIIHFHIIGKRVEMTLSVIGFIFEKEAL